MGTIALVWALVGGALELIPTDAGEAAAARVEDSSGAGAGAEDGGAPIVELPSADVVAVATTSRVRVDGRVDEAAWAEAKPFSTFVESFPEPGKPADLRTEVRVLYDQTYLYIAVTCADPHPELIIRSLGRRDSRPFADTVEVAIDSSDDQRTAYDFIVNAAGVQRDQLLFSDVNISESWDAVWDAASALTPTGWSTELAIPLRVLRFSAGTDAWGFQVRRVVPHTHQVLETRLIPRNANAVNLGGLVVSRFGRLTGVRGLQPGREVELNPYLAARAAVRPQFSDPAFPTPRLFEPSADLGLDFKLALTSRVALSATVNPDFGQVEADQLIQNLTTAEQFFPEKRPFFLQGLDVFEPAGSEYGSQMQMFYSRRIGLQAPILAAVKVTGTVWEGLDIGLLDVVVTGAGNPSLVPVGYTSASSDAVHAYEANPDGRYFFHPNQPLHLGPNFSLPNAHPVSTNYLAAVARKRLGGASSLGLSFTAATPLEARCQRGEFLTQDDFEAAGCAARGANALALDWNLRDSTGEWGFFGQVQGSQQVFGNPKGRTLADGIVMKPFDLGYGGHFRAGKLGGEPFRFDVVLVYLSPKLDLNQVGFQQFSNFVWGDLDLSLVKPNGLGVLRSASLSYNLDLNWSADGRGLPRGVNTNLHAEVQLPSYDTLGVVSGLDNQQFDTREIDGSGVPFQRLPSFFVSLYVNSDRNRRLTVNGDVFVNRLFGIGPQPGEWGWGVDLSATWHPLDALETRLDLSYGHRPSGARWIENSTDTTALFGSQDPEFLSVTLRQQVVITPKLTFQLYAQLFSGAVRYGQYWSGDLAGKAQLAADALVAVSAPGNSNIHASALNLNAVLRWEYRLGSTLFLVYSRSQQEAVASAGQPVETGVLPARLFAGPATDTVLLKWTYWWST